MKASKTLILTVASPAILAVLACSTASQQDGDIEGIFGLIPDDTQLTSSLIVNDYELASEIAGGDYRSNENRTKLFFAEGPFYSGEHVFRSEFEPFSQALGFTPGSATKAVIAGNPPDPIELVEVAYDPDTSLSVFSESGAAIRMACEEIGAPPPPGASAGERSAWNRAASANGCSSEHAPEQYRVIGYGGQEYFSGNQGSQHLGLRLRPPIFDHLGRAASTWFGDGFIAQAMSDEEIERVISAGAGDVASVASNRPLMRLVSDMAEQRSYSYFISDSPPKALEFFEMLFVTGLMTGFRFTQQQGETIKAKFDPMFEILEAYEHFAIGSAIQDGAPLVLLLLQYVNDGSARDNAGRVRQNVLEMSRMTNEFENTGVPPWVRLLARAEVEVESSNVVVRFPTEVQPNQWPVLTEDGAIALGSLIGVGTP